MPTQTDDIKIDEIIFDSNASLVRRVRQCIKCWSVLLKLLLGEAPSGEARRGLDNTGLWMVELQENGSYSLIYRL